MSPHSPLPFEARDARAPQGDDRIGVEIHVSQGSKIFTGCARAHAARRRRLGQCGQGDARPQGPQCRAREVVRRPAHHQRRRDGGEGDRARGQVREHGRADGARGGVKDLRHRRRRDHHCDPARAGHRQGRREVGRRWREPDGSEARRRHGRNCRSRRAEGQGQEGHLQRRDRASRHHLRQWRPRDRRHDRQGHAESRQ